MGSRDSTEDDPRLPTNDWDDLDEDDLVALAARAAGYLLPGDVVVLRGEVGAGKTTFVRAAARALGVREAVTSPTYQFARGYEGSVGGGAVWVNHLDLYRLEGLDVRDALELDEYLQPDSIAFIEWADPALGLLKDPSVVELSHRSPETRRVRISGPLAARLSPTKC
ncbi:MAG: tRNA (adenosine(37)-N6)-threonylcarbamoyltransferase complex ATPase subunit type 1 TsaE [Actinomycetota bacterium]|nr:tRNA (adenosine(37)-N6)-threonylcarbamoyltransferase complex ATPase subunit type 1 TsaE [Actinomycetota bacterium]